MKIIQPRAVKVSGPYAYLVYSDLASLTLTDLRFSIRDGADFFLNLSSDEYQGGSVAFVGTEPQVWRRTIEYSRKAKCHFSNFPACFFRIPVFGRLGVLMT